MAIARARKERAIQDILRLSPRQAAELLRWLDEQGARTVTVERRRSPRRSCRRLPRVCALLENEARGRRTYALLPRNISDEGMSLLQGKFVYGGTNCVLGLQALDGQMVPIRGRVLWCRLITGRIHELGVHFDEAINVADFVDGE